ncbi:MAG: ankyrin repeat domain-containing protein, partial [Alphaproteobacteria bacterium]
KTAYSFSPLADACEISPDIEERLDLLIRAGVDINETNPDKETPLIVAAQTLNARALNRLLSAGADKTAKNAEGKTAYDIAVENSAVFDFGPLTGKLKTGV